MLNICFYSLMGCPVQLQLRPAGFASHFEWFKKGVRLDQLSYEAEDGAAKVDEEKFVLMLNLFLCLIIQGLLISRRQLRPTLGVPKAAALHYVNRHRMLSFLCPSVTSLSRNTNEFNSIWMRNDAGSLCLSRGTHREHHILGNSTLGRWLQGQNKASCPFI